MQMIGNLHNRTPDSIKYLPAVFHGEAEERHSPLWALLLTIEHFFGQIEDRIKHIEQNFDIYQAHTFSGEARENKDFLSWLFTWVAFDPDQSWSEQKKRYVLGKAAELYTYRGTITGLRYMLDLFFGIEVEVSEWTWPRGMQVGVQNTIGIDTVLHEKPNLNHCFVITWHVPPSESGAALRQKVKKIRALIDRERPGHTRCYFAVRNQLRNREGKRK
jgi:phage tail-like protein